MNDQEKETSIREELNKLDVEYEILDIDPDFSDTRLFCEKYSIDPENAVNALVITSKSQIREFVMPLIQATRRVDVNHKLKDIAGFKRLSFADAELTKEVTGMELGAVTPVGLTGKDIPVYVDQPIMSLSFIILGAGVRSQKIKTTPDLFNKIPYSQIVEISQ